MATGFLPRNPSKASTGIQSRALTARKISSSSRKLPGSRDDHVFPTVRKSNLQSNITTHDFDPALEQRIFAAQQRQAAWYEGIAEEASRRNDLREEQFRIEKEQLEDRAAIERQAHEIALQTQLESYRARLTEEAEQRRLVEEERTEHIRRVVEEQLRLQHEYIEQERIRREEAEARLAERARITAEEEEERRRLEEEETERVRREREKPCAFCLEEFHLSGMKEVPCGHWYCRSHLPELFRRGQESKTPFQCCGQAVSPDPEMDFFTPASRVAYEMWLLERATTNPVFCANLKCGAFIPAVMAEGPDEYLCLECGRSTCRHCRKYFHMGRECTADVDTQEARKLAEKKGWKQCPSCRIMVEKKWGCSHISCRCGTQFCYRCGRLYKDCSGRC